MTSAAQRIHAIVLAGAHAWGESILERVCPRPLLPVAGRPLVWFALDWLRQNGVHQITVCANSDTPAVRSCLGEGESIGVSLDYYEDPMPRGPAGCARDAANLSRADLFVIVEGTVLPRIELSEMLGVHRRVGAALTIAAIEQAGNEGAHRTLEPAGVYLASKSALELVPLKGYQDIKEVWIPRLYQHGYAAVPYLVGANFSLRVSGVGSYLKANALAIEHLAQSATANGAYRRMGRAWVHHSAHLADSARITDHALIGPRVTIDKGAAVMGSSVIGAGSRIGASAILSHVVAWSDCQIQSGAILNHCILLDGSSIEQGLVVRGTIWGPETISSPPAGTGVSYWALDANETHGAVRHPENGAEPHDLQMESASGEAPFALNRGPSVRLEPTRTSLLS